jgi:hypothetical protein
MVMRRARPLLLLRALAGDLDGETVMSRRLIDGDPVRADGAPMARGEDRAGFKIDCACFEDDAMSGLSVAGRTGGGLSKLG